jgi:hypothetical protein
MTISERTFTDEDGAEWVVREVANPTMPASLAKLLGKDRRATGWLLFRSDTGGRRRLSPYPSDWATISDFEIAKWCVRAKLIPPAPGRREEER